MAIIGHGVDLESLEGIGQFVCDEDWLSRVFSNEERAALPSNTNRIQSICGHWCLKEAVLKALGVGFAEGIWLHDIRVSNDAAGKPSVSLFDDAERKARELGITAWHVSISHSDTAVVASAIAEGA